MFFILTPIPGQMINLTSIFFLKPPPSYGLYKSKAKLEETSEKSEKVSVHSMSEIAHFCSPPLFFVTVGPIC